MIDNYKDAVKISNIRRIPWKAILGMSFTQFVLDEKWTKDEDIIHEIMLKVKEKKDLIPGWNWEDINKNVRIGVSARRAEQKIYG